MTTKSEIMATYDKKRNIYQSFAIEVKHQLEGILAAEGITCNAITYRLKTRDSLDKKIDIKNGKYKKLDDITDIAGIRIITYYADDVDRVAEIVEHEFVVDKENSIDKRESLEPDRFGYCSVHYVAEMSSQRLSLRECQAYAGLKCEIQIRSVLQHAWAEIEHDLGYKNAIAIPKDIRRNFSRLAGLLEVADKEFNEIRQFLSSYEANAKEKITEQSYASAEIDAILLETIIESNADIHEINNAISKSRSEHFSDILSQEVYAASIEEMRWFGISTIGQLMNLIAKNKNWAIKLGTSRLLVDDTNNTASKTMYKTIAFFYLCYAELLLHNNDPKTISNYLIENNIGDESETPYDIAQQLLQLKESVGMPTIVS